MVKDFIVGNLATTYKHPSEKKHQVQSPKKVEESVANMKNKAALRT